MIRNIILSCKILLFTICITQSIHIFAGPFDKIGNAINDFFNDPCNVGIDDKHRRERWDGEERERGKRDVHCPPYKRESGRHDETCLVRFSDGGRFPGSFIGYYNNLCAEAVSDNNYFYPKIKVRGQKCNAAACWTSDDTLKPNQCITLPGVYGLPLDRMCARVAIPADSERNLPADPGYTKHKHLDNIGKQRDDEPVIAHDGTSIMLEGPKLCVYRDPMLGDISNDGWSPDYVDFHPYFQPLHKTAQPHIVAQALIFILNAATQSATSPLDLLSLLVKTDNSQDAQNFNAVIEFISEIIRFTGAEVAELIKILGSLNRVVDDHEYGCVNIPLGPYPPPFCDSLQIAQEKITISKICPTDVDGIITESTHQQECVVSNISNNYVRNSLRVSYNHFVPLCDTNQNINDDECVIIKNLSTIASAKALHSLTNRDDLITKCNNSTADDAVCVHTNFIPKCSNNSNECTDNFRIVYGFSAKNTNNISSYPSKYFRDDLDDCANISSGACQVVLGVDVGEFLDLNLTFPATQETHDIASLERNFSLVNSKDELFNFTALLPRYTILDPNITNINSNFVSSEGFTQGTNRLCVLKENILQGCVNRAPRPNPQIYECDPLSTIPIAQLCTSSYFKPQFIVSYSDSTHRDTTSAIIAPENIHSDDTNMHQVNLAGDMFDAFVTDEIFTTKPFTGVRAINNSTLLGFYKNDILPIVDGVINDDALYLHGLEYINGKYRVGGKYAYLELKTEEKCPNNPDLCVLSKLLNSDIVDCNKLNQKSLQYFGLKPCNPDIVCNISIDTILKKDNTTLNIKSCDDHTTCYDHNITLCEASYVQSDNIYDFNPEDPYDNNLYTMRNKTSIERGWYVNMPTPTCNAVEGFTDEEHGFASWPSVALGQISYGSCKLNYNAPIEPLARRCIAYPDTQTIGFEPLYTITTDPLLGSKVREYSDMKCIAGAQYSEEYNRAYRGYRYAFSHAPKCEVNDHICQKGHKYFTDWFYDFGGIPDYILESDDWF